MRLPNLSDSGFKLLGYNKQIEIFKGKFDKYTVEIECNSINWNPTQQKTLKVFLGVAAICFVLGGITSGISSSISSTFLAGGSILVIVDVCVAVNLLRKHETFVENVASVLNEIEHLCINQEDEFQKKESDMVRIKLLNPPKMNQNKNFSMAKHTVVHFFIKERVLRVEFFETERLLAERKAYYKAKKLLADFD